MYFAQIAPWRDDYDFESQKGWLRVIFRGEIRVARPCYRFGEYFPPDKLWIEKYHNRFGVWIIPESTEHVGEEFDHLVYVGFEPYEDAMPDEVRAAFPSRRLSLFSRWEMVVGESENDPFVLLNYSGNPEGDKSPHPEGGTPVCKISFKQDEEAFRLSLKNSKNAHAEIDVSKQGVDIKFDNGKKYVVFDVEEDKFSIMFSDAEVSAVIGEKLKEFYEGLKSKLDRFDNHIHATGLGPSDKPSFVVDAPAWDSGILSKHVKFSGNK